MKYHLATKLNILDITGIFLLLFAAFIIQFLFHELPCPLCLLQRWGLLGVAYGFLLNLRFGFRPSHYAISILSAFYTAAVALRQILLHITPGTGSYGPAILGFHLYTWVFLICVLIILFITFMLLFDQQFKHVQVKRSDTLETIIFIIFALIILLTFINSITTLLECGIYVCPDNPIKYKYL